MGDPGKLMLLEGVVEVIKKEKLLEQVKRSGDRLFSGLKQLQGEFPALLSRARGRGTFLAITCSNAKLRDDLVGRLRAKGERKSFMPLFLCYDKKSIYRKSYP
jgi:4-aminobutyrate aminotransferase / (S)-3-amino-2-methylpropionate transaminase